MSDHHAATATVAPLTRAIACALSKPGLIAAAAGIALSPTAFAATYTVGNLNDSGAGSLRDAIAQANANAGDDIITFASNVSGTISLTSGSLYIYGSGGGVDVRGPGASVLTIDGTTSVRPAGTRASGGYSDIVINGGSSGGQGKPGATLAPTPVTISGITLTGGSAPNGGGINANYTLLNVNNCVITGNNAYYSGGGIAISSYYSALTVNSSTISNNTAGNVGGGVATTDAAIDIQQSSVTGNTAGRGGGIHAHNDNANALTISASTVSGNTSTGPTGNYSYSSTGGGGVYTRHMSTSISNSTIANNTSNAGYGGGFGNYIDSSTNYSTTLSNSTVSGNSAPYAGGVSQNYSGAITLTNSVVGGNTARYSDNDVGTHGGGTIAAAFSLFGDTGSATITDNGGNLLNVAPQLGALASNGGPTQTMLPLSGSPLINAGDPAFSGLSTDQRGTGFPRIVNGRVDIGAVEFGSNAVAAVVVPAPGLGLGGQLGLGALLGLAGLAVARRRRSLGTAAGVLMAAALSLSSANPAQAAQGHETKTREAVTIASYSVDGKLATIVLGDGQTLTAPKWQVRVLDRRSSATSRQVRNPSSVASGTPAAVSYETGKNGKTHHVRIRLADSLQQAQTLLARKP